MCGIVGVYKFNSKNKTHATDIDLLKKAFVACSSRGGQATGFWSPQTGTVKADKSANEFVEKKHKELKHALDSGIVMGHCRAATSGFRDGYATPAKNENNHPHESEDWVLVHNGSFVHLPEVKDYKYHGDCDSELAVSYIQTFGIEKGIELMSEDDGFSLVFINKKTNDMYFFRHTNPLVMAMIPKSDSLIYASTTDILYELCRDVEYRGLILADCIAPINVTSDVLYKITGNGLREVREIKLRKYDTVLFDLPNEIKDKLALEEFKKKYHYRFGNSGVQTEVWKGRHNHINGNYQQKQIVARRVPDIKLDESKMPFVIISWGKPKFTVPMEINA